MAQLQCVSWRRPTRVWASGVALLRICQLELGVSCGLRLDVVKVAYDILLLLVCLLLLLSPLLRLGSRGVSPRRLLRLESRPLLAALEGNSQFALLFVHLLPCRLRILCIVDVPHNFTYIA